MSKPTKRPRGRPTVAAPRVRVPVRLPVELRDWVNAEAKRRGVSATAVIEIAIRKLAAVEGVESPYHG